MQDTSFAKRRLVVLISGRGSNLQQLIEAEQSQRLPIDIVSVISNRPDAGGLELARRAGVASCIVDHQQFPSRETFDQELARTIEAQQPDLIVLAGFMRVLTSDFVKRFQGRMINLHPSLLPHFPGLHTHRKVIEAGHAQHGSSVHFVTEQLDGGPVLAQVRLSVDSDDTAESLRQRLVPLEHQLLEASVGLLCQHRVTLIGEGLEIDGEFLSAPLTLIDANNSGYVLS